MKYKGINYDTGTRTLAGGTTREIFDPKIVAREMEIIKNELHCNAVRISGYDLERVSLAANLALGQGLSVWFGPSLQYDTKEKTGVGPVFDEEGVWGLLDTANIGDRSET